MNGVESIILPPGFRIRWNSEKSAPGFDRCSRTSLQSIVSKISSPNGNLAFPSEKIKFKSTMPWTEYKLVMGTDTKEFWKYTNKKGETGWMSTTNIGDEEFVINVSKKLVPNEVARFEETYISRSPIGMSLSERGLSFHAA